MPEFHDDNDDGENKSGEKKETKLNEMLSKINGVQCGQAKLNF